MNKLVFIVFTSFAVLGGCQPAWKQGKDGPAKDEEAATQVIPVSNTKEGQLRLAYIGNMGVLIESANKTALIDGLHSEYKPAYLFPTDEAVEHLINGKYQDFSPIEVNLVTHKHGDHFDPELCLEFLRRNRASITMGSDQIRDGVRKSAAEEDEQLADRIEVVAFDFGVHEVDHQGIRVQAIRCDHTYQARHKEIKNIAYLVHMNGFAVLHVGDTDWDLATKALQRLGLGDSMIDLAILPYWMLVQKTSTLKVEELINPRQIMATHIDPRTASEIVADVKEAMPGVRCLTEVDEIVYYER